MKTKYYLAFDVGGTSIKHALVSVDNDSLQVKTIPERTSVNCHGTKEEILECFCNIIKNYLNKIDINNLLGLTYGMPGPFDYENGICLMKDVNKYDSLYGINVKQEIKNRLNLNDSIIINFKNDAEVAGLGEAYLGGGKSYNKFVSLTLGTGFGSIFMENKKPCFNGPGVPEETGMLYAEMTQLGDLALNAFSYKALEKRLTDKGFNFNTIKDAAENGRDNNNQDIIAVFKEFTSDIATFVRPYAEKFGAEAVVIGGGMANAADLYKDDFQKALGENIKLEVSPLMEQAPLLGSAIPVHYQVAL